jgi:hypothetical protein
MLAIAQGTGRRLPGCVHAYRALALMHAGRTSSIHRLFVGCSCISALDFCVAGGFMLLSGTHLHGCLWIFGEGSTGHIA